MNGPFVVNATSCARCGNWHDWLKDDTTPCCDECEHVAATPPGERAWGWEMTATERQRLSVTFTGEWEPAQ